MQHSNRARPNSITHQAVGLNNWCTLTPIAAALALSLSSAQPANAATINVGGGCEITDAVISANSDTATGGCTAGSGADILVLLGNSYTLNTALFEVDIGDGHGTLEPNSAFPAITSNITIQGNGATIARGAVVDKFRLFYVEHPTGTLALESVTLTNGYADGVSLKSRAGGAIYSKGTLSLDTVTVTANTADLRGGGVHALRSVSITNSYFSSNSAGSEGGGLGVGGAGSLNLSNTTISGNTASAGGGLQSYASEGNTIVSTAIIGNSANGTGGGVSLFNTDAVITDSTISSNTEGSARGGGMQVFEGSTATLNTLSIYNTTMNMNSGGFALYSAIHTTIEYGEFNQNTGGGLELSQAGSINFILANANTGVGMQITGPSASIMNCRALSNTDRGASFYGTSINYVSVSSCSFNSNGAGGVALFNGSLTDVTVSGNSNSYGIRVGDAALDNVTVTNNSSTVRGAGILASENVVITDSTITGNSTSAHGGGMYVGTGGGEAVQLIDTYVAYNTAARGGGVYARQSSLVVQNSDFVSNQATGSRGGGLDLVSGNTGITLSTIHGNQSGGYGGGVYAGGGSLTISTSAFTGNSATYSGGGLLVGSTVTDVSNSTFFANNATQSGGGISARSGTFATSIRNATITGNISASGGGIETVGFDQSMLSLYSTIIANNTGGGCYNTPIDGGSNWFADASCNGTALGDPGLDTIAHNPSGEAYFSPLLLSGVIDSGGQCELATDQNGTARSECKCDVGAVEILELEPDNQSCKGSFFIIPAQNGNTIVIDL